jgi:hypothetical protein
MEYQAYLVMNEKCFLTSCKTHAENENKLVQHESTHLEHMNRMKVQIAPFWQFIKVNTPDVYDHKFYDFLDINKNPRLQSVIYKCTFITKGERCKYISATKMGHKHRGVYVKGNLTVQIETVESEVY